MRNDWEHVIIAFEEKREKEDLSLRQVSELCGVSFATLSRINRHVSMPTLQVLEKMEAWT